MTTTALQVVNAAFRDHNLEELSNFSGNEFPDNVAQSLINEVIRDLNRMGDFWFSETKTALTYSNDVYQYTLADYSIDPKRIVRVRREATNYWGDLTQKNWEEFQRKFRSGAMTETTPNYFSKYAGVLEFDTIPDQDYSIYAYHYRDIPLVTSHTDNMIVPDNDVDLLERGCYFYLGYRIGKWDYATAIQLLRVKASPFLVQVNEDSGIPSQMPANF